MNKSIIILILLLATLVNYAQEVAKDSIGTEEVNIIKPYTPKIKDAFKIKKNPVLDNDALNKKEAVNYAINSVPVASTFTPAKGKAKGVSKKRRERVYDNFASVGFGNYTTPKIEIFAHTSSTRDNDFGGILNFHSSDGADKTILNSNFLNAKLAVFFKNSLRDFDWQINAGYNYQKQNWYGISDSNLITQTQIDAINPEQIFNTINLGGNVDYYDSFFKGTTLDLKVFTDAYKTSEIYFMAKPNFEFPVSSEWIDTFFRLEYVGGNFDKNYHTDKNIKYGYYNLGISPNFKVNRDFFSINLGANLVYSGAVESTGESKFFIYPNVTASYELIQDVVSVYASVTGDLNQNTYQKYTTENPFVSPTLFVGRTNEQYYAKFGTKGKLASNISFNINASYKNEEAKPLFVLNEDLSLATDSENYQYANSFNVIYDDVKTLGFFGELTFDFSKELSIGGNANFNSYTLKNQSEAWNLPALKASAFANYHSKKWSVGANLFFVGERKDSYVNDLLIPLKNETITNKSYIDFNANLGYKFTNRLSAFINGNNLFGTNYEQYTNFKVQGIQVLGGIKYKFDL